MAYHLLFNITPKPEGVERSQVPPDTGACDALVLCSVIYTPDGGFSMSMANVDGRDGSELEPVEVWKVWALMAHQLMGDQKLERSKRELCRSVHETVKAAVLRSPITNH